MCYIFFMLVALHIPDGFVTPVVALAGWLLLVLLIQIAVRKTRAELGERQVPLMGVLAAFVFAAQALNFPIAGGTSGHLLGAALVAIVVGPWAGSLVMVAVVIVQGLMFQDGGLLAMGWNAVNLGFLAVLAGYAGYSLVRRFSRTRWVAAFVGAWLSVEMAAAATAVQLAASGTFPLDLALPALVGIHILVGLGEGVVTVAAVGLLQQKQPELLRGGEEAPGQLSASAIAFGLTFCLLLVLLSPLASEMPDGLESVALAMGFDHMAAEPRFEVFSDYTVPFVTGPFYSTVLAMIAGTVAVCGLVLAVGRWTARVEE